MIRSFVAVLFLVELITQTTGFSPGQLPIIIPKPSSPLVLSASSTSSESTVETSSNDDDRMLSLSLEKPLGMILEEVEEGAPQGVYVLELAEDGSAATSAEKNVIVGSKLVKVMGEDVSVLGFDDVMDRLINAPSPVDLELALAAAERDDTESEMEADTGFSVGTDITVVVQRDGEPDLTIKAKVGDNLRKTLLENEVEVYRGFKAKIGNCGGGGQCGFCAVEFIDSEGWAPRSDYEANKIKNSPNSRLSCLNNIQGPVTIKM